MNAVPGRDPFLPQTDSHASSYSESIADSVGTGVGKHAFVDAGTFAGATPTWAAAPPTTPPVSYAPAPASYAPAPPVSYAPAPPATFAPAPPATFAPAPPVPQAPPTTAPVSLLAPAPVPAAHPAPAATPQARPAHQPATAPAPSTAGYPPITRGVAARGRSSRRGDIAVTIAGIGLGISMGIGVASVKGGLDLPGGMLLALGTLSALAGTYLCLALLLLISRIPWLEREVGHDRMVKLHRTVAPYSLLLIALHVVFTTLSYAQAAEQSVLGQLWTIITKTAWMVPAATAFVLMMSLGVMSYRRIRSRMKYETWWVAHLYFYIAVALSFGHQVALGPMFVANPAQRYFWTGLYLFVGLTILVARFALPIITSRRHQLHVVAVVPETGGVVSVYIGGHDLDHLRARGGQFFQWRFITREWWWQAHPYSLSASPNPSWLRVTVKSLGDQSTMLRQLKVGTRVWAEGPYGVFTAAARSGERVTAFAAGVGITPIRAVLDDLPPTTDVTLVYRVSDATGAPLRAEIDAVAAAHGWRVHYLEGSRTLHPINAGLLTGVAPLISDSDVYVCGPDSFTSDIVDAARKAGVPHRRIHHEAFSF